MLADIRGLSWSFPQSLSGGRLAEEHGIRIDHLLLSLQAADRLRSVEIDKAMPGKDKASDHTSTRISTSDGSYLTLGGLR